MSNQTCIKVILPKNFERLYTVSAENMELGEKEWLSTQSQDIVHWLNTKYVQIRWENPNLAFTDPNVPRAAGSAQQKVICINSQTVIRENMGKEAVLYTAGLRPRYENPMKIWKLKLPNPDWV